MVFGVVFLPGSRNKKIGILGASGSCATYLATVTIIPFFPDWAAPAEAFRPQRCSFSSQISCSLLLQSICSSRIFCAQAPGGEWLFLHCITKAHLELVVVRGDSLGRLAAAIDPLMGTSPVVMSAPRQRGRRSRRDKQQASAGVASGRRLEQEPDEYQPVSEEVIQSKTPDDAT
jgi:hypothetical protein